MGLVKASAAGALLKTRLAVVLLSGIALITTLLVGLAEAGTLFGRTLDESGAPLAGINVSVQSESSSVQTAITGAAGNFRFSALPPGNYTLYCFSPQFVPHKQSDITVNGRTNLELTILLKATASNTRVIRGTVADPTGSPLGSVSVTLSSDLIPNQNTQTDDKGVFRFEFLPPSDYSLVFAKKGYPTVRKKTISVVSEDASEIGITLIPKSKGTVVAGSLVDREYPSISTTFDKKYLDTIPTTRNIYSLIDQTPGVDSNTYDVAGVEIANQASFFARGSDDINVVWNYDGINVTSYTAAGAGDAERFYDFGTFDEVQITTAAGDVSVPTGGVIVNIVTRRPGNKWSGGLTYFLTTQGMQNNPVNLESITKPLTTRDSEEPLAVTDTIEKFQDFGADISGPVFKDKLYLWTSYRYNHLNRTNVHSQLEKITLTNFDFKGVWEISPRQRLQSGYAYGKKSQAGVKPSPLNFTYSYYGFYDTPEPTSDALQDLSGPQTFTPGYWTTEYTWTPDEDTVMNLRYGYIGTGFTLDPVGGTNKPVIFMFKNDDYYNPGTGFSTQENTTDLATEEQRSHALNMEVNHFQQHWPWGDHQLRFGFDYKNTDIRALQQPGNGVVIDDNNSIEPGGPLNTGRIFGEHALSGSSSISRYSLFASDTIQTRKLTVSLGLHFDRQTGEIGSSVLTVPPGFEPFMEPKVVAARDPGIGFDNFSPRLGATYDWSGNGKTILRGTFSRFGNAFDPFILDFGNPALAQSFAGFSYTNKNEDRVITPDEYTGNPFYGGLGFGPLGFDLTEFLSHRIYDPDLKNTTTTEITAGFERELFSGLRLSADYIHRKYSNLIRSVPYGITPQDFTLLGVFDFDTPLGHYTIPYYELAKDFDGTLLLTNIDGYSQSYDAIHVSFRTDIKNSLTLAGALVLQNQKGHYDGDQALGYQIQGISAFPFDPTYLPFLNNGGFGYPAPFRLAETQYGDRTFPYSKWQVKLSSSYRFPRSIEVGAFIRWQQGYPFLITASATNTSLDMIEALGEHRLDNSFTLDMRLQKEFSLGKYDIATILEVFNLTNADTAVLREGYLGSPSFRGDSFEVSRTFGRILRYLPPRAFRLGLKLRF